MSVVGERPPTEWQPLLPAYETLSSLLAAQAAEEEARKQREEEIESERLKRELEERRKAEGIEPDDEQEDEDDFETHHMGNERPMEVSTELRKVSRILLEKINVKNCLGASVKRAPNVMSEVCQIS